MTLLCYGDSNTYGFDPRSYFGGRYPAEVRWTHRLAQATGWAYHASGDTSPKETVAVGAGEPSIRHSTVTTVARVTLAVGAN